MSHRGGNVITWAEPDTLSPIREKATLSHAADPDAPLGEAGKHPWQPRAPWNDLQAAARQSTGDVWSSRGHQPTRQRRLRVSDQPVR